MTVARVSEYTEFIPPLLRRYSVRWRLIVLVYSALVPQLGQNFAVGVTTCLQLGQVFTFGVAGVVVSASPQFGQNFDVTGAVALHLGQSTMVA